MAAVAKAKNEIADYSEAAYVDSQYEYLQEHKSEGITLEELRRRRAKARSQKARTPNVLMIFGHIMRRTRMNLRTSMSTPASVVCPST